MVELELTSNLNDDFSGKRIFNKNLVYFGSDHSCDIFTPGTDIQPIHGFIEIIGTKLLLHLGEGVQSVHLDGKLTTSLRYLKIGQQIKFGQYEIKVAGFLENHYPTCRDTINKITDELIQSGSQDLEILKSIQEHE